MNCSGRGRKSLFKGNVLGSGVKDPYATDMRNSGVSSHGFYKCVAIIAAVVGELQIQYRKTQWTASRLLVFIAFPC